MQNDLDTLGFNLVGYGCTTCIGNSGPLAEPISKAIYGHGLAVASVLSGNRNFEGRVNHDVRANYLASPPLVVAYALAGSVMVDLATEPLGTDTGGEPIYLKDIWPSSKSVAKTVRKAVKKSMFRRRYGNVFDGDAEWRRSRSVAVSPMSGTRPPPMCRTRPISPTCRPQPEAGHRHCRRAHSRPVPRFHHHRPHLAGRRDQA